MAQEKEEAAISDDAAPKPSAQPDSMSADDTALPVDPDPAPVPETPADSDVVSPSHHAEAVPEPPTGPSPEIGTSGDDTKSSETMADQAAERDDGSEPATSTTEPPKKIRRILPARASGPTLDISALTPTSPWTPLRKLAITMVVAWCWSSWDCSAMRSSGGRY